jgi:hypothetical protein
MNKGISCFKHILFVPISISRCMFFVCRRGGGGGIPPLISFLQSTCAPERERGQIYAKKEGCFSIYRIPLTFDKYCLMYFITTPRKELHRCCVIVRKLSSEGAQHAAGVVASPLRAGPFVTTL